MTTLPTSAPTALGRLTPLATPSATTSPAEPASATATVTATDPDPARRSPVLVVAQDHRVRAALAAIVTASPDLELSGQAASGREARDLLDDEGRPHTVVVDLDVPVPAGPLALVADLAPAHDVIALTARRQRAVSATSAGAVAVASTVEEVEEAISATAAGTAGDRDESTGPGHTVPAALRMSRADLLAVLLAVFLPPWAFWFSAIAQDAGLIGWRLPQGAALWSMALPLVGVAAWRFGTSALRDLAARVTRWRVPVRSYAAAILGPLALGAIAAGSGMALGAANPVGQVLPAGPALAYLVTGTGVFLLTEELAWRGVLLPRLLPRSTPCRASLLVGAMWAVWHLPLLNVDGEADAGLPVLGFVILVVATSVLMTGLVGLARGSVLVAALGHAALDASYSWFGVVGRDHRVFWSTVAVASLAALALHVTTRGQLFTPTLRIESPRRSVRLRATTNSLGLSSVTAVRLPR